MALIVSFENFHSDNQCPNPTAMQEPMQIIPAIDLKNGRCVRLKQGDLHQETAYSDDPPAMARHWERLGAPLLHVVYLDGAFGGRPKNTDCIEAILKAVSVPVQIGGGIRTMEVIRRYFAQGVSRIVLGTAVLDNPALLASACAEFPDRMLVGLDAKGGNVAVRGWTSVSGTSASDLVLQLSTYPLAGLIYTDIAKDGMLEGPNLSALADIVRRAPMPVIASGGISRVEDIRAVRSLGPRIIGAIVGKALYDGKLELKAAMEAAREGTRSGAPGAGGCDGQGARSGAPGVGGCDDQAAHEESTPTC